MLTNLNKFLTAEGITDYLDNHVLKFQETNQPHRKSKEAQLDYLKKQLKQNFFEDLISSRSDNQIVDLLATDNRFKDYPYLQLVLKTVLSLDSNDDNAITEALKSLQSKKSTLIDWQPSIDEFHQRDLPFGYFTSSAKRPLLETIFKCLAARCRAVAVLVEQNNSLSDTMAYDYAYKLMALFVDESQETSLDIHSISLATEKLLTNRDIKTDKPFHTVLLTKLILPIAHDLGDKKGWIALIKKEGERAFPFFEMGKKIEEKTKTQKAPSTIPEARDAAALLAYTRAAEDPEFAALCYSYESNSTKDCYLENTFNKCLDFIGASVWPKKNDDSIPDIVIKGEGVFNDDKDVADGYFWVKIPASDKRALILGKITDCCQSIGGDAEQCVKDAVSLSDNAIYVLLKRKSGGHNANPIIDGNINYSNFQIIGQSYLWTSTTEDLCLDSIEYLKNSIPKDVLRHILFKFATQVMATNDSIQRITIGRGGRTPQAYFLETNNPLKMKQGTMYGDASRQYVIAQRPDFIIGQNKQLHHIWQTIVNKLENNPDFCTIIKTMLTKDRIPFLNAQDTDGRTLLHVAFTHTIDQTVEDILSVYPNKEELLKALHIQNKKGQTALHELLEHNPNDFLTLLSNPFQDNLTDILDIKDNNGMTLLSYIAAVHESIHLKMIPKLPDKQLISSLKTKSLLNRNNIFVDATIRGPDSFAAFWNILPDAQLVKALEISDHQHQNIMQMAIHDYSSRRSSNVLDIILRRLSHYQLVAVLTSPCPDLGGTCIWEYVASNNRRDAFVAILNKLPEKYLIEILSSQSYRNSLLYNTIRYFPDAFMHVQNKISMPQLVNMLQQERSNVKKELIIRCFKLLSQKHCSLFFEQIKEQLPSFLESVEDYKVLRKHLTSDQRKLAIRVLTLQKALINIREKVSDQCAINFAAALISDDNDRMTSQIDALVKHIQQQKINANTSELALELSNLLLGLTPYWMKKVLLVLENAPTLGSKYDDIFCKLNQHLTSKSKSSITNISLYHKKQTPKPDLNNLDKDDPGTKPPSP